MHRGVCFVDRAIRNCILGDRRNARLTGRIIIYFAFWQNDSYENVFPPYYVKSFLPWRFPTIAPPFEK